MFGGPETWVSYERVRSLVPVEGTQEIVGENVQTKEEGDLERRLDECSLFFCKQYNNTLRKIVSQHRLTDMQEVAATGRGKEF